MGDVAVVGGASEVAAAVNVNTGVVARVVEGGVVVGAGEVAKHVQDKPKNKSTVSENCRR